MQDKDQQQPLTGAHIAPKSHGSGCPCCMPGEDEEE